MADFRIEKKILRQHFKSIAGVDEVGRGALFGPVVAAAVVIPPRWLVVGRRSWLREVNDSKLLSPRKRRGLADRIVNEAEAVGLGLATNCEIDETNIYWASFEAMKRAVGNLPSAPDFVLVDGFKIKERSFCCPHLGVPRGDQRSISIAAASIVAKVVRDEMIVCYENLYSGYNLAKNKGYGTKEHYRALREKGPTPLHRLSFNLKSVWGPS